jgi:hypothetical protein
MEGSGGIFNERPYLREPSLARAIVATGHRAKHPAMNAMNTT